MNRKHSLLILLISTLTLASCSNMPKLFWSENEGSTQQPSGEQAAAAPSQQPLVVPPDLRGEVSVPMPDKVASDQSTQVQQAEKRDDANVAGTAVALDTRVYDQPVATVFSAVVDAMTSLNMPVQSVDSPSGTITTDWVRKDASNPSMFTPIMNMFGASGPLAERYRFVVRVLRLSTPAGVKTQLEIRMLGQVFENRHWVNKQVKYKASNDLFSAVEGQLARQATAQAPAAAQPAAPASSATTPASPQ